MFFYASKHNNFYHWKNIVTMISKEILKKIRKLEIQTKGLVNNLFGGEYQSAFKGRGMAFSEVRSYSYGDDIRQIDWNVTARTGEPFIKIFEEEREQTLMLCIDISNSGSLGTTTYTKTELAIEICAVLAFSAIQNGDKVGLVLFSDIVEKVVPPKKGKKHVLRIIRELYTTRATGKGTSISTALNYVNRLLNRRSIVVLASDFQDNEYETSLKITNQKHDLVNLSIRHPFEEELPSLGLLPLYNAETGEHVMVDSSNKKLRAHLHAKLKAKHNDFDKQMVRLQMDTIVVHTDKSYIRPLMSFFQRRLSRY
jgi:uncharacterized protein (DUF58 family)